MALCFKIKFFYPLGIINCLRIYLCVSDYNTLPYCFVGLLECDVDILFVFDTPERVLNLHLLLQLAVNKWDFLVFEFHEQTLWLDLDITHLGGSALGNGDLDRHFLDALTPSVFVGRVAIVGADLLHVLYGLRFLFWWCHFLFLGCFLSLLINNLFNLLSIWLGLLCPSCGNCQFLGLSCFFSCLLRRLLLLFEFLPSFFGFRLLWESSLMIFLISAEVCIDHALRDSWWEAHLVSGFCHVVEICSSLEERVGGIEETVNSVTCCIYYFEEHGIHPLSCSLVNLDALSHF